MAVTAALNSSATASSSSSSSLNGTVSNASIASNFQTFLTLLTTQLQNQNPLDPLDTNQFTQQLVQFAQVEQQLKSNDQLGTLISIQKSLEATNALSYVGATVAVDGSQTQLSSGQASWSFNAPSPAVASFTITDSTGQTAFSGTYSVASGNQPFTWNGVGNDGKHWPDGTYKLSITGADTNGKSVAISTQAKGVVDSVDVSQSPPLLSINGQSYPLDKIRQVVRATS